MINMMIIYTNVNVKNCLVIKWWWWW